MSKKARSIPIGSVGNPVAPATFPTEAEKQHTSTIADNDTRDEQRKSSRYLPLFREPLSNHPADERVAAMRAAIQAGADVHQLDQEPIVGYNEGRPLDACINTSHFAGGARLEDNIPAIELLLQYGADPRLGARPTLFAPVRLARYYAENAASDEAKATWKRILALFDAAIWKLGEE